MQPPVVTMTDCSFFSLSFKQRKATAKLKEDTGRSVAGLPHQQSNFSCKKFFGVPLQDLHQQGLTENGIPALVGTLVDYLTKYGEYSALLQLRK